jgi:hypothetical protein
MGNSPGDRGDSYMRAGGGLGGRRSSGEHGSHCWLMAAEVVTAQSLIVLFFGSADAFARIDCQADLAPSLGLSYRTAAGKRVTPLCIAHGLTGRRSHTPSSRPAEVPLPQDLASHLPCVKSFEKGAHETEHRTCRRLRPNPRTGPPSHRRCHGKDRLETMAIHDQVTDIARAAAQVLAPKIGPGLPADVEQALRTAKPGNRPAQFPDVLALISAGTSIGSVVVAAASFAWTISSARRKHDEKLSADEIRDRVLEIMKENGQQVNPTTVEIALIVTNESLRIRDESNPT